MLTVFDIVVDICHCFDDRLSIKTLFYLEKYNII